MIDKKIIAHTRERERERERERVAYVMKYVAS